jgi:hypothetical protein
MSMLAQVHYTPSLKDQTRPGISSSVFSIHCKGRKRETSQLPKFRMIKSELGDSHVRHDASVLNQHIHERLVTVAERCAVTLKIEFEFLVRLVEMERLGRNVRTETNQIWKGDRHLQIQTKRSGLKDLLNRLEALAIELQTQCAIAREAISRVIQISHSRLTKRNPSNVDRDCSTLISHQTQPFRRHGETLLVDLSRVTLTLPLRAFVSRAFSHLVISIDNSLTAIEGAYKARAMSPPLPLALNG